MTGQIDARAEAGQSVRGAGRAGDGDPGGEAGAGAESDDPAAHIVLAAEQMGDSAEIEQQAVGERDGGARGPAARGEQGEALEEVQIGGGIVVANVEAGDEGARLGDGHSGVRGRGRGLPARRRRRAVGCRPGGRGGGGA